MSDIVTDLRELRTQMATILDDETILDVFSRAASQIEKHRTECKSMLAWVGNHTSCGIVANSKFCDEGWPLQYVIKWNATEERWRAEFESACVCMGALADCMYACEEEERCHDSEMQ